jgi:hypothetical protein
VFVAVVLFASFVTAQPPGNRAPGSVLYRGLWVVPAADVSFRDLVQVEVVEGQLVVAMRPSPRLEPAIAEGRTAILNLDGQPWAISAAGRTFEGPDRRPTRHLRGERLGLPGDAAALDAMPLQLVSFELNPSFVKLTGRGTRRGAAVTVTLQTIEPIQGGGAVQLDVVPAAGGAELHTIQPDLVRLLDEQPAATRLDLDPLLRTFASGRPLLTPRAGDVYAMFPSLAPGDDATERLRSLLPRLGSPDPDEREAASAELARQGDDVVLAAMRLDAEALPPEEHSRLEAFVRSRTLLDPTTIERRRDDLATLIDCLEFSDPRVRVAAAERIRTLAGPGVNVPDEVPDARAREIVERLREALLPAK